MQELTTIIGGVATTVSPLPGSGGFVKLSYRNQSITVSQFDFGAIKEKAMVVLWDSERVPELNVVDIQKMNEYCQRSKKKNIAAYYEEQRSGSLQ